MSMTPPTIDDIRAAAARIDGAVVKTPMLTSRVLSDMVEAEVWLKFENLQFTAAYKERGALNKLLQLTRGGTAARRDRRVGRQPCPGRRLSRPPARHSGDHRHAQPDAVGEGHPDREPRRAGRAPRRACSTTPTPRRARWRRSRAIVFVHPFDDPQVIAGAGTIALEMLGGRARPRHFGHPDRRRRADFRHRRSPPSRSTRASR